MYNNGASASYDPLHIQGFDDGTNQWNKADEGNYWRDWTTPDANHDGIVDVPYSIAGGSNQDLRPISSAAGIQDVEFLYPANGSCFNTSSVKVAWHGLIVIDHYNISIDGGAYVNISTATSHTFTSLADGTHHVILSAIDDLGNNMTIQTNFIVDTSLPTLTITKPNDNSYNNTGSVKVAWTGNDVGTGLSYYLLEVAGRTPVKLASNVNSYVCTGLEGDGCNHTVTVTSYDRAGNHRAAAIRFGVSFGPDVSLDPTSPIYTNASSSTRRADNVTDHVPFTSGYQTYYLNGTLVQHDHLDSQITGRYSFLQSWPVSPSLGVNVWYFTFNDTAGNSKTFNITAVYDTGSPVITISGPSVGEVLNSTTVDVRWSCDSLSGIKSYQYRLDIGEWSAKFQDRGTSSLACPRGCIRWRYWRPATPGTMPLPWSSSPSIP